MRKFAVSFALVLAALVLAATAAFAEDDGAVRGVFEALTAEGSAYDEYKTTYRELIPGMKFAETLDGDSFTVSSSGYGMLDGSWTFVREGDYLTLTVQNDDLRRESMASMGLQAAWDYLGMNRMLAKGYLIGLRYFGESPWYRTETDEASGTTQYSIRIAGPCDLKELDEMAVTEEILDQFGFDPLTEESTSRAFNLGKISVLANGSGDSMTVLLQEYGELDELALRTLTVLVNRLKPAGYEAFAGGYTELKDAEGEGWSVQLNPDGETVREICPEPYEGYSSLVAWFGE